MKTLRSHESGGRSDAPARTAADTAMSKEGLATLGIRPLDDHRPRGPRITFGG